jgi:predicted nucleotidyltransferase
MLSPLERLAVAHFRASLEARFGGRLAGLTLFGSRARGEGDEDSDVDLYVVIRDVTRAERREVQDLAFDVELEHRVRIAPLVRGAGFDALGAGLAAELRRDGVSL